MNEKGLSFEYLYLPGETQYPTATKDEDAKVLSYYQLGDWILGNFETIEDVKKALANVVVVNSKIPGMEEATFPLHASIFDASGKGIVVEFVDGKMNIHDNELGILTNSPTYPWHVTNLRNFVNLSPYNPSPVVANGITFSATGQGAGMMGTPGDISPPSRFIKIAILLRTSLAVADASEALNLSEHIINNVDIPAGLSRVKGTNGEDSIETTQWTVFKDLTHKVFYYRTYNDLGLRAISLDKLDFSKNAALLKMPISSKPVIRNITEEFINQK
jgi:choloylglycine hydrolase